MDPLTALRTLFAYERRTGKILTDQQIRDGELKNLLCAEDFESAEKVTTYSLLIHLYFRQLDQMSVLYQFWHQGKVKWFPVKIMPVHMREVRSVDRFSLGPVFFYFFLFFYDFNSLMANYTLFYFISDERSSPGKVYVYLNNIGRSYCQRG